MLAERDALLNVKEGQLQQLQEEIQVGQDALRSVCREKDELHNRQAVLGREVQGHAQHMRELRAQNAALTRQLADADAAAKRQEKDQAASAAAAAATAKSLRSKLQAAEDECQVVEERLSAASRQAEAAEEAALELRAEGDRLKACGRPTAGEASPASGLPASLPHLLPADRFDDPPMFWPRALPPDLFFYHRTCCAASAETASRSVAGRRSRPAGCSSSAASSTASVASCCCRMGRPARGSSPGSTNTSHGARGMAATTTGASTPPCGHPS